MESSNRWSWVMGILVLMVLATFGFAIYSNFFHSPYDIVPDGTVLECKIQEDGKYFVVAGDGEVYRLELGGWALLNVPRCK